MLPPSFLGAQLFLLVCMHFFEARYFNGKSRAEQAIAQSFPSTGVLIKPSFIYGGDSFGLTPPRVSDGYGSGIDALLSSGPIRAIAGISPGLIKVDANRCPHVVSKTAMLGKFHGQI